MCRPRVVGGFRHVGRALRERELVTADYLITCKPVGEPTRFDVLRSGLPRTIVAVLGPLQPPPQRS